MIEKNSKNVPYFLFKLPNDFQAVFWPLKGIEVVAMALWIRAGAWYETDLKKGSFHFLEHALCQGTKEYPSYKKLSEKEEGLGLRMSNGVSGEMSDFQWSLPRENFEEGLKLLSEYLFQPLFPHEGIERERKIILQEYQNFWDSPHNRFWMFLSRNFWGENHPYTFNSLGTVEGIKGILRNDLLKTHQKWYQPQNMTLVVVGDLEEKRVKEKITKFFGRKPKTDFSPKLPIVKPAFKKKLLFHPEDLKQINLSILFPTFGWKQREKKEEIALYMLSYILGASRWSRLTLRLREEEPLAYIFGTRARVRPHGGIFEINTSFSFENTKRILEITREETGKIRKEGINFKEFGRTKKYYLYQTSMSFDSVYGIADNLISYLFREGKIFLPEDRKKEINKVKKEDVERLAKEILAFDKALTGMMGRKDLLEKIKKQKII